MVNANVNTPKKNRKSLANAANSPNAQAANLNANNKTPGKNQNASPVKKQNFSPGNKQATPNKPGLTPGKKQNSGPSPAKNAKGGATPAKNQAKNEKLAAKTPPVKRANDGNPEGSPAKKLKMFAGTEKLDGGAKKEKSGALKAEHQQRKGKNSKVFKILKEKVIAGDNSALKTIEEKIKTFEGRTELTKTANRKLKLLQRMKRKLTGEGPLISTPAQKKNERKKKAKANFKAKQAAIKEVAPKQEAEEDSDSDEESEDLKLGQIIKTDAVSGEDESDDEDGEEEESEDEEASGEEEEEESGEEEEDSDEEADSDEVPELVQAPPAGRRVNVQYTQGGKKKGPEQKKEVKAKNLKLQAMRKQGQLAGSGKQNQKRAARRNKNANKVNGA